MVARRSTMNQLLPLRAFAPTAPSGVDFDLKGNTRRTLCDSLAHSGSSVCTQALDRSP
jgi:hypothetical protein